MNIPLLIAFSRYKGIELPQELVDILENQSIVGTMQLASQAQAEDGTSNSTVMTPLRTMQLVQAYDQLLTQLNVKQGAGDSATDVISQKGIKDLLGYYVTEDDFNLLLSAKANKTTQLDVGKGLTGGGTLDNYVPPEVKFGKEAGTALEGNDPTLASAMQGENNLSELNNLAIARDNLGLGNSATRDVGQTVDTVMAGNDPRVESAMQGANNLSELVDIIQARENLGLGNSATLDMATDAEAAGGTSEEVLVNPKQLRAMVQSIIKQELGQGTEVVVSQKAISDSLDSKVDKVAGLGLSELSYTTAERVKLDGIEEGANLVEVVQTLGNSSSLVMSQKAVTDALKPYVVDSDYTGIAVRGRLSCKLYSDGSIEGTSNYGSFSISPTGRVVIRHRTSVDGAGWLYNGTGKFYYTTLNYNYLPVKVADYHIAASVTDPQIAARSSWPPYITLSSSEQVSFSVASLVSVPDRNVSVTYIVHGRLL